MPEELANLDLSSKTFDEFVRFFFARRVVSDDEQYDYFLTDLDGQRYDESVPSSPIILIGHMTRLFSEFGHIANKYSLAQVDQAVWGILGAKLRLYEFLFDASIPLPSRVECIRSMYFVYSDFVAKLDGEPDPDLSGFIMWWDLVLHGFWAPPKPFFAGTYTGDASRLDSESRVLLDVMFETLKRILDLPHTEAQRCALHGLGHLHHPGVRDAVQHYIDANKSELPLLWLEQCRDGIVQ
ncbi:MAG: hypothetical protein WCA98_11230 [Candidatus Acidiferrales bacterium]